MAQSICVIEGCNGTRFCKQGWCQKHYRRWKRQGDPLVARKSVRLYPKVDKRFWKLVEETPACHIWKGSVSNGYGVYWIEGSTYVAHRLAFQAVMGFAIYPGWELHHICQNRLCVRFDHLQIVTPSEHAQIEVELRPKRTFPRKTHCPKGHPYVEDNIFYSSKGYQVCLTCWGSKKRKQERALIKG